jgi:hypothetical protein
MYACATAAATAAPLPPRRKLHGMCTAAAQRSERQRRGSETARPPDATRRAPTGLQSASLTSAATVTTALWYRMEGVPETQLLNATAVPGRRRAVDD